MVTKIIRFSFLAYLFIATSSVNANILYANAANITSIWKTAGSGDTIKLSGTFSKTVALQHKTAANPITIDATEAKFTATLKFQAVDGVRVIGGSFDATAGANAYGKAIVVYSSSNISFDQQRVISAVGYGETGISFENVTNGKVTNGTFTNVGVGVSVTGSRVLTITGNKVIGASRDGYDVYDDHQVLVANNSCSGSRPSAGAHPDCVQVASTAGKALTSDVEVLNNIATGTTQGFTEFLGKSAGALRITISGNIVNTTMPQGIACYGCVDSFITNNFLSQQPGASHFVNMNIIGGLNNVVTGNSWLSGAVYLPTDYLSAYFALTGKVYIPPQGAPLSAWLDSSQDGLAAPRTFGQLGIASSLVPEPGGWLLLLLGFFVIGVAYRRKSVLSIT